MCDIIRQHRISVEDGTSRFPAYEMINNIERCQFWYSHWSISRGFDFLEPLKKAIRREEALRDPGFGSYIRKVWAEACMSIWENKIQHTKPTDISGDIDLEQIRTDIRTAPDNWCALRPPIGDVPIHFGGILDTGPKTKKESETIDNDEDPDWFMDERYGVPAA